jgi:hypothetical protein
MSCLEKLTLNIRIENRDRYIDSTHTENEILVHMPQLHSFNFYICTYIDVVSSTHYSSAEDIQRTFTNIDQPHVARIVNYMDPANIACSIFSIPFTFYHLDDIGNTFPNIIFSYVTYLSMRDVIPFNHELFIRVARGFPLLTTFRIWNNRSQSVCDLNSNDSDEIAHYTHLTSLDIWYADIDYLEQFLDERKTYVPCLTNLKVFYQNLTFITNHFAREETRRNCAKIKRLNFVMPLVHPKDFYVYFPLL